MGMQPLNPADRATKLIDLGYSVILLHGRDSNGICQCPLKKKCKHEGPHPVVRSSNTLLIPKTSAQAQEWWRSRPSSEIGIAMRQQIVAFVCDGPDQVDQLSQYGDLGQGVTTAGSHRTTFFFRAPRPLSSKECVGAIQGARFYGEGDWLPEPGDLNLPAASLPEVTASSEKLVQPDFDQFSTSEFPLEVFPVSIKTFIEQAARSIQCAPAMVAGNVLAISAGAIGASRSVEIKPSWIARSSVYCAIVAPPGAGKSPAARHAKAPIEAIQAEWDNNYQSQYSEYKKAYRKYLFLKEHWEEQFRKSLQGETAEPGEEPELPIEPKTQQIYTTDSTPEAVFRLLKENAGSLLCVHDELRPWLNSNNRDMWLEIWCSAATVINRKTSDHALSIRCPVISVVGNLPTDSLKRLGGTLQQSDGFLDRILFFLVSPNSDCHEETSFALDSAVAEQYEVILRTLLELRASPNQILKLTEGAKQLFFDWARKHRAEINHPSMTPLLKGMFAKIEEYCARLSLILHLLRVADGETTTSLVDDESMVRAIRLTTYFKHQARLVLQMMTASHDETRVEKALSWIRSKGAIVTLREFQRNNVGGVRSSEEASALFTLLESHGYGTVVRGSKNQVLFSLKRKYVAYETSELLSLHRSDDMLTWFQHN